jgi:hypothetical protein
VKQVATPPGSSIGCGARKANGKPYIYCTSSRPSAAYVAPMAANGRTEVLSVKTQKAVFDRTPAAVARRGVAAAARVGDVIVLEATSLTRTSAPSTGRRESA